MTLAAFMAAVALAQAEDPQVRREVENFYHDWDRHIAAGDFKALIAMIDPSFAATDETGHTIYYKEAKAGLETTLKMAKNAHSKVTVDQVQVQGGEVVAWVHTKVSYRDAANKPVAFTLRSAETLRRVGGNWKLVAVQLIPKNYGG